MLGKTGLLLHELVSVSQLVFILKEHYSLVTVGARDDENNRSKVRAYLLLIIKEFIAKVACYNWIAI